MRRKTYENRLLEQVRALVDQGSGADARRLDASRPSVIGAASPAMLGTLIGSDSRSIRMGGPPRTRRDCGSSSLRSPDGTQTRDLEELFQGHPINLPTVGWENSQLDWHCHSGPPTDLDDFYFNDTFEKWTLVEVGSASPAAVFRYPPGPQYRRITVPITSNTSTYFIAPFALQWFAFCSFFKGADPVHMGWRVSHEPGGENLLGGDDDHGKFNSFGLTVGLLGAACFATSPAPKALFLSFRLEPDVPPEVAADASLVLIGRVANYIPTDFGTI